MSESPYYQMAEQHMRCRQQDSNHQRSTCGDRISWEADAQLEAHLHQQALLGVQQLELQRMGRDNK
jgi:hypothetical protein